MSKKVDGKVIIEVDALTDNLESKLKSVQKTVNAAGALLAGSLVGLGSAVVAVGKEFETAQKKASTLFGNVNVDVKNLNKNVIELSNSTGLAATEISGALYSALSAGVEVTEDMAQATEFLKANSKLAIAGFTDVDTAVGATAKVLNAYGLELKETDRIHGILIATQNKGITTVNEMSGVLAQVTPTAAAMNVSFEQVGASLALLTAQGTPTAQATTQLNALFAELGKSGTIGANSMKKALEGTEMAGKSFSQLMGEGVRLNTVLDSMSKYASENNLNMIDLFSSIESGKSALSIANASEIYNENMKTMMNTTGEVDKAYEKMMDTFENKANMAEQKFKNLGITAYDKFEQPMKDALDSVNLGLDELASSAEFSEAVDELANAFGDLVKTGVDLVKKVLPGTLKGLSWLIKNIGPISVGIVAMNVATKAANAYQKTANTLKVANEALTKKQIIAETALKAVKTPLFIGLVVGAIAAVCVGYVNWANSVDSTTKKLKEEREAIKKNKEAFEERTKASKEGFEQSLVDIAVLEKHANFIEINTDETGKFIGSQEKLQIALKNINDAFPGLNVEYDQNTQKIVDQNGEVITLEESIRKLIETKKVEAYLDTHKQAYGENVKVKQESTEKLAEYSKQFVELIKDVEGLEAVKMIEFYDSGDMDGLTDYLDYFDLTGQELHDIGTESGEIYRNMKATSEVIGAVNEEIGNYENITGALIKGDLKGAVAMMEGITPPILYDPSAGKAQIDAMKEGIIGIEEELKNLETFKGFYDQDSYEATKGLLESNLEERKNQLETANKDISENAIETNKTANSEIKSNIEKFIDDIIGNATMKLLNPLWLTVKVKYEGLNYGVLNPKGATFSANEGNTSVFPAFATDTLSIGKKSVVSLYGQLGEAIGYNVTKSNVNSVANNNFSQTNVFNIPVTKPSQQTKAIEQASRNLLKVR